MITILDDTFVPVAGEANYESKGGTPLPRVGTPFTRVEPRSEG